MLKALRIAGEDIVYQGLSSPTTMQIYEYTDGTNKVYTCEKVEKFYLKSDKSYVEYYRSNDYGQIIKANQELYYYPNANLCIYKTQSYLNDSLDEDIYTKIATTACFILNPINGWYFTSSDLKQLTPVSGDLIYIKINGSFSYELFD